MDLSILKSFGINGNDILVYKALLSLGRSKTGPIIKSSNMSSSRVYESLRNLLNNALVSYQVKNNIKYYVAEPLNELISTAKENTVKLEELTKEINRFPTTGLSRNEVNVYEGKHGFRMAFTQHAEAFEKNEVVSIIAFSSRNGRHKELRSFLAGMEKIMKQKGCRSETLRDKESQKIMAKFQTEKIHRNRFLPTGYFGPNAINISKKEVLISIWGEKPVIFSIKNPTIVEGHKRNFDFLWALAKKN